ncbi:hypothetical protein [Nannocystis punicea]|uniref:MetA-pathway of phenol degradation n=1 Tax=Nannocystis punicea TaxID=2995304 RepID=A0ABY7GWJ4_9BACT|nr:hypothetical protein [Nannocystis poenicansa]WAS91270.1 hypothetical protein O0S08_34215 [Nannocystis poenicansa]
MRRALIVAAALLWATPARAEQCHGWSGTTWRNPGLSVGVRMDAAGYRNRSYEGDFEGLAPMLGYSHRRVSVQLTLPAYRLVRNGLAHVGIGDLALAVRAPIPSWSHHHLTAGLGLGATFPTGSADAGLGMGHVMLMPEFWWLVDRGRVQFSGTAGFGRALTRSGGDHHAHGPAPIVNPMNRSEVEASLFSQVQLHRLLWLRLGVYGAMPVGNANTNGVTRVIVSQGLTFAARGFELSVELQAPLAGAPFLARGVVQAGYRFDLRPRRRRPT